MAATSPDPVDVSYEDFVRLHADRFRGYLRGVLGRAAEGRGGRVAVDDTLQEALLRIYAKWPELQELRDDERDRRLYRYLRDAAGQALRAEHGQLIEGPGRPRVIPFDFSAAPVADAEQSAHERELTSVILGAMVRDLAAVERDPEARAMLDRGILIAALRALTEREAVLLIAVNHLGWDQHQLADRLGMGFAHLRRTLFDARKVFYALVRHAVGLEVEEEERARLAAYLAGELVGKEKREARRHLQHCRACQGLQREQRVFGRDAFGVLSPLPFIFGGGVLVSSDRPWRHHVSMATERFLISESGPDVEAERAGIRWVLQWAQAAGQSRAAIIAPGVREIEPLERALGSRVANILSRQREFEAEPGLTLEILLGGKLPFRYDGPVFVPWAHDPLIDKVEEMHPPAICAQPWAPNDLSIWRRSWALADPRSGAQITTPAELSHVVTAALTDLTHIVNLGTGIGHPSDKASAVDLLKALRHGNETLDGAAIRAWAAGHGWEPRHARRLGELAQKVADGVAVRGGRRPTKTEMNRQLARWRQPTAA